MLERLIRLEEDIRYHEPPSDGEPEFVYIPGTLPILISAPHAAGHTRFGIPKEEDEFTGGFAQLLGQETGAHVLYARRKSATDPNVDPDAPYKHMLEAVARDNLIRFVLDIHGVRASRQYGIELGTARDESCTPAEKALIVQTLTEYGFTPDSPDQLTKLRIDQINAGAGSENAERVIGFVCKRLHISAAQFELNAHLRIPQRRADASNADKTFKGNPVLIAQTIQAFGSIVKNQGSGMYLLR